MTEGAGKNFIDLTANIVSAYLSNNPTPASEIPNLISQIHAALLRVSTGRTEAPLEPAKPAISLKKSMTPDYLVCLEDGKRFKSLKRHLRTKYNMTPEQYREKWGLPSAYPSLSPRYFNMGSLRLLRSIRLESHTWLAQPCTLFSWECSASGIGSSVRPSSMTYR